MVLVADAEEVLRQIGEVLESSRAMADYLATLDRNATVSSNPTWHALSAQALVARNRLAHSLREIEAGLASGDRSAGGLALAYLEADPYYVRSGYARGRLAVRLSRVTLTEPDLGRARDLVVKVVDGQRHCGLEGVGRLAGSVANNELRRALRARLRSADLAVARRALRTIVHVRHPGVDAYDVAAARALVVVDAGTGWFLPPGVERLALWLWDPAWQSELRLTSRRHGPERAGARRLLDAVDRRQSRRPGP